MRTVLLNLPYPKRVIRRYTCSYNAPNFLFPPLELMYLGGIIREWKRGQVILFDAVAEVLDTFETIERLKEHKPDILVCITGFEIFDEDINEIHKIKKELPRLIIILIGYLPSQFPKEILQNCKFIDYIIIGEPEKTFSELYDILKDGRADIIQGVAGGRNGHIVVGEYRKRIQELDILPFPSRELLKINLYSEFLLPKPFTTILTSRGCPFECNYCVRTYGKEVVYRSIDNVLKEIKEVIIKYNVKTIRFMDDTFTLNRKRVIALCREISKERLNIKWSCLSRVDQLDDELVNSMKKAGCVRIYVGLESGSQKMLDYYKKGYQIDSVRKTISSLKNIDIEIVGFFMVGAPEETKEDFKKSIALAKELAFNYIILNRITPYPGTEFFKKLLSDIHFGLFPYTIHFKNNGLKEKSLRYEKEFYHNFYFRLYYYIRNFKNFLKSPRQTCLGAIELIKRFILYNKKELRRDFI